MVAGARVERPPQKRKMAPDGSGCRCNKTSPDTRLVGNISKIVTDSIIPWSSEVHAQPPSVNRLREAIMTS